MTTKRPILSWMTAIVLAIVVVCVGITASDRVADPVCSSVTLIIKDSLERQYVSAGELRQQLSQAGLWQVGQPLSKISCQQIERHLLTHPMLRQAECYKLTNGELRILVRQRQPIMLIAGDEHYYLDTDRKVMPVRASVSTPVVVVNGRIGHQQAEGEMYDFVTWLNDNRYWREKIHTIHVTNPRMIELKEDAHHYTIVLGPLADAEQRMDDLQKLYENGFEHIGYPEYKQIDLQYSNQIIGRK
ncbi:MAG: hypothetical protein IJT12_08465 [Paludibacteraceae bacterium]|nr:hypothetical protein [Paludibacteraceae bacterium]